MNQHCRLCILCESERTLGSVPPENRGRDFWPFLGKWQFLRFGNLAIFGIFSCFFVQFCAIFNVFSAHPRDGRFFFNLQKKI